MASRVEIWQGHDGRWYFHLVAGNGRVMDRSEGGQSGGYATKYGARRGAKRVHPGAVRFDLSR